MIHKTKLAAYEARTGFILDWMICGFFPNQTVGGYEPNLYQAKESRLWTHDYLGAWGGEAAIRDIPLARGAAAIEWLPLQAPRRYPKLWMAENFRKFPELQAAMPAAWDHQWYALAVIESDREQPAELRVCGNDGHRLWWNGQLVHEDHSWHKLVFDLHVVHVRLAKGRNSLLLKLDRAGLLARITAPGGKPLAGTVRSLTSARPREDRIGAFEQLSRYAQTLKVQMRCEATTPAQLAKWKRAARAHFRKCLGTFPKLPARPRAEIVERTPCDGYTRYRYHLAREAGSILPVYVLVPDADRFNGRTVICPHGHGQDDKQVAGVLPPAKPYSNWCGPYSGNYVELMAQAGFLSATWAERALSHERNDPSRSGDPCNIAGLAAQAMGMTLPGLHLFDLHGVYDLVCGLRGVDRRRIGLMGLSGGGVITNLAGAYDDRFAAMGVFSGLHSYMDYAAGCEGCGQQIVPGLFPTLDTDDLMCLMAPRPLLLCQGRRDVMFNVFLMERFYRHARRAYAALGRADRVELDLPDLAHQVNIVKAIEFFAKWL